MEHTIYVEVMRFLSYLDTLGVLPRIPFKLISSIHVALQKNVRIIYLLTLKDAGFLVFQIRGGGLIQSILEKRTVTPPNFILEEQTESHMKAEVFS